MKGIFSLWLLAASAVHAAFWMEQIAHQGVSPFNPDKDYKVFRNVKDFGAKGDGVSDDTAAINQAISSGNRCGGLGCNSSTLTPAIVSFPTGTYLISSPINGFYYTQIIGDPNNMPTSLLLQPTSFSDSSSLDNDTHIGLFMESGSGGVVSDPLFANGKYGARLGSQQSTMRNLTFQGSQTGIYQIWNWGWTYKSLNFNDCEIGIDVTSSDVGSVTLLDSNFTNVKIAILSGQNWYSNGTGLGSLVVMNNWVKNVSTFAKFADNSWHPHRENPDWTDYTLIKGHIYAPYGPFERNTWVPDPFEQPSALKQAHYDYYKKSKPQYESYTPSAFHSARTFGAVGDGVTDDTQALNSLFQLVATTESAAAFLDAGYYRVTDTVYVPPSAVIVGEGSAAVILAIGDKFSDISNPHPVVQIGRPGEEGVVEMSDIIVSTQGATAGAVLIEYNLKTPTDDSAFASGLWDVHTRIGGFAGSELQVANCPITPDITDHVEPRCIAAYMSMHITPSANGICMENNWPWVADHDLDDAPQPDVQFPITVFAGRGLWIEGSRIWLVGTSVEHHVLYQYQLVNASNVWMGQVQTESLYYQPNPKAPYPFTEINTALCDPDFVGPCDNLSKNDHNLANSTGIDNWPGNSPCEMVWGLRIIHSSNVTIFGAGLYSFFNNYNKSCSTAASGENCQARILEVDQHFNYTYENPWNLGIKNVQLHVTNLNTIGSVSMATANEYDLALWSRNSATNGSTVAYFGV
ncbi:pectin lyase fold/virulence factor [Podospora australis]|uniref:Pectin lyase fold/virulence factor n=1 Tax=Podospora australis TaxID=1536484 RepID=A0AAN6WQK2_9PEZI|nr:pectin lyase fold/virulence factor [Podospora australis]